MTRDRRTQEGGNDLHNKNDRTMSHSPQEESPERALCRSVIHLRRLLHCMENTQKGDDDYGPLSHHDLLARADLAQDLWHQVQESYSSAVHSSLQDHDSEGKAISLEQEQEAYLALQQQVEETCRLAKELAEQRKAESDEVDWVEEIFFKPYGPGEVKEEEDILEGPSQQQRGEGHQQTDESNDREHFSQRPDDDPRHGPMAMTPTTDLNVEDLQKVQRQQLEEEISHMASKLKESTQRMNQTLKSQTEELTEMEDLAVENVDRVGKVADDVTEHNRRQWRNTVATWTMVFVILGTFCFCFLTIRMVPQRKNACLFFCASTESKKSWNLWGAKSGLESDQLLREVPNSQLEEVLERHDTRRQRRESVRHKEWNEEKVDEEECTLDMNGECAVNAYVGDSRDTIHEPHETAQSTGSLACENGECLADYHASDENEMTSVDESVVEDRQMQETVASNTGRSSVSMLADTEENSGDPIVERNVPVHTKFDTAQDTESLKTEGDQNIDKKDHPEEPVLVEDESPLGNGLDEDTDTGSLDHEDLPQTSMDADAEDLGEPGYVTDVTEEFDGPERDDMLVEDTESIAEPTRPCAHDDIRWASFSREVTYLASCLAGVSKDNLEERDENGWRLIHEAVAHIGSPEILRLLLEAGADVNSRTGQKQNGYSPLALAIERNGVNHRTAQLLQEYGAVELYPEQQ